MKKLFLASIALVAINAGGALAADIPVKARPLPPPPPLCAQFGGWYVGGHVGGTYYDHSWNDRDAWAQEVDSDNDLPDSTRAAKWGGAGGVQGGFNWQSNCAVFGVEVDYSWAKLTASAFHTDGATPLDETLDISSQLRGYGTLRLRAGIVMDNVLLYVTGGVARGDFRRTWTLTQRNGPADIVSETFLHNKTLWGAVGGVGAEWSLSPNWSIKGELLYMHFERDEPTFTSAFFDAGDSKGFANLDSVWVTRIGVNYRFGGFGKYPVTARY